MMTGWKEKDDRTIAGMREFMERENLVAFIPTKIPHVAYLLNYYDKLHANILWEEMTTVLVVPRDGEAFVAGSHNHVSGSVWELAPWWLKERHGGGLGPGISALEQAVELMKTKGLDKGRIGIERKAMPVAMHDYLRDALPDAELVSADLLVPQLRFIKTEREIKLMRKSAEIAISAMEAYMTALRNGASVQEAQCIRAQSPLELGGEWVGGPYKLVWTGGIDETPDWWDAEARECFLTKSRNWNSTPDNVPCLVTHFEGLYQYYFSDLAWHEFYREEPGQDETVSLGGQDVLYSDACHDFEVIRRIQTEALMEIQPGMDHVTAKQKVDAFLAGNAEAKEHIIGYFIHGLGLEVHEEPVLSSYVTRPTPLDGPICFEPGAVVSSEWFTTLWTVEEPFVMTNGGWEPIIELRSLTTDS